MELCPWWSLTETPKAVRQCLMCLPSFMTTYKKSRSCLVFLGWTGTDPAAPMLKTCFFLKHFSSFPLYRGKDVLNAQKSRVWLYLNNSTSPVGVQWLEAPPTALADLTELLTELYLSVTLPRKKKKKGTMEPQLVITTWRAMVLCLSPSPPEPFEGTP